MYCRKCGNEMKDEDRYCLRCGYDQTVVGHHQNSSIFDFDGGSVSANRYRNQIVNNKTNNSGCFVTIVITVLIICGCIIALTMLGNNVKGMFKDVNTKLEQIEETTNIEESSTEITEKNVSDYMWNIEQKIETLPNMTYEGYLLYYNGLGTRIAGAELVFKITKANMLQISSNDYINWIENHIKPLYSLKPLFPIQARILFEDNSSFFYALGMTEATNECYLKDGRHGQRMVKSISCEHKSDFGTETEKVFVYDEIYNQISGEEEWQIFLDYAFNTR